MRIPRFLTEDRWRVACFLGLGAVFNYADRSALSAVLVPLRKEFGLTDVQLGMLLSLFLWCYALASPFAGNFADRYSKIRLLIGSIAAWSIFTALIGAANGLVLLCVLSVGLGVAESIFNPAAFALVGDHHGSETRGTAMAILSVGAQFGVVAGGACAGFMAERYGWRTGFWALGAIGLALALTARLVLVPGPGSASKTPQRAGFFE